VGLIVKVETKVILNSTFFAERYNLVPKKRAKKVAGLIKKSQIFQNIFFFVSLKSRRV